MPLGIFDFQVQFNVSSDNESTQDCFICGIVLIKMICFTYLIVCREIVRVAFLMKLSPVKCDSMARLAVTIRELSIDQFYQSFLKIYLLKNTETGQIDVAYVI